MSVWVLLAVIQLHEVAGGHVSAYIAVYSTAAACDKDRAKLQTSKGDTEWRCLEDKPRT
jgi:hypothetical protein